MCSRVLAAPSGHTLMAVTADKPAPYAPAKPILEIINRYRERGLVFPITAEVLARVGIPDSLIPRTAQALQTLDLFKENGNPTETLEGLRLAPEAEFKQRLGDWLKAAYADVFAFVDPSTDDEVESATPSETINRSANSPGWSPYSKGCARRRGSSPTNPRRHGRRRAPRSRPYAAPARANNEAKDSTSKGKGAFAKPSTGLPPALVGLLESLPTDGWTTEERTKFIGALAPSLISSFRLLTRPPRCQPNSKTAIAIERRAPELAPTFRGCRARRRDPLPRARRSGAVAALLV